MRNIQYQYSSLLTSLCATKSNGLFNHVQLTYEKGTKKGGNETKRGKHIIVSKLTTFNELLLDLDWLLARLVTKDRKRQQVTQIPANLTRTYNSPPSKCCEQTGLCFGEGKSSYLSLELHKCRICAINVIL